jgi:hypothetical protein
VLPLKKRVIRDSAVQLGLTHPPSRAACAGCRRGGCPRRSSSGTHNFTNLNTSFGTSINPIQFELDTPFILKVPFQRLLVRAVWHRRPQCWLAAQPVLGMAYLAQYLPSVSAALMRKIGPRRTSALDAANSNAAGSGAQVRFCRYRFCATVFAS